MQPARLSQPDGTLRLVARTGRDQVWNGEPVCIGHLPRQRGVPVVEPGAHSGLLERPERIPGVSCASLDARHHDLLRGEPGGETTAVMLEEDAEKALETSDQRPVEDHRTMPAAGASGEAELESGGQDQVHLDRPTLPGASQAVAQRELQLRPVERTLSRLMPPGETGGSRRVGEQGLCPVPDCVVPEAIRGTAGEGDLEVLEAERRVQRPQAPDEPQQLARDLVLATEDVPVVLRELTQAEQAVERSGGLVAVDEAELGDAQRKLAPGWPQAAHQLHVPGTADRLQSPGLAL